ncbi:hypothetical protein UPYG_G00340880 [Umbra pygmaea]|uniref:UPAR/Ly6 domain-containing protein n=1 Tax=Umbra pygmaea TaxID=75934 RepID=A0ABD0WIS5_UMBPY
MIKIVFGISAVVASFVLADSLTCNQCSLGLVGFCLNPGSLVCMGNSSSCFTGKATFPSISAFPGFNSQGCMANALCGNTTTSTILGATYTTTTTCCSTNLCNPVVMSGAPSAKLTITTALGAALMASLWGSML